MTVIETTKFSLAAGVDEATFLAADKRVQEEFAPFQPGCLRRTTARGEDGQWIVIEVWAEAADADRSVELSQATDVVGEFTHLIDPATLRTNRWTSLDG